MNGRYKIEIKYRDIYYILDIKRKFTIVTGETGSGKTSLCELLNERLKYNNKFVKFRAEYPIKFTNYLDDVLSINKTEKCFVFLDEGEYLKHPDLNEYIRYTNAYYVIFSRYPVKSLSGSIVEVCELGDSHKDGLNCKVLVPYLESSHHE